MRKLTIVMMGCFLLILSACSSHDVDLYTDNDPMVLPMQGETLKILQLTDLHLTYGIDHHDRLTYQAIEDLILSDDWDLVVFTGDMVMSPFARPLLSHLVKRVERLGVHWTFILGNHDRDYHSAERLLNAIGPTEYLLFKGGPELDDGGVGNFKITVTRDGFPFYHLYFLDSKSETDHPDRTTKYDFLSEAQVRWYETLVAQDTLNNLVFIHTPLQQFEAVKDYLGTFGEPVHPQGIDTGFFDLAVSYGLTKGIFVGHDHDNDFAFTLDGILLAYGRYSGHNAYGFLPIGGRAILIDSEGQLNTHIITHDEVAP